MDGGVTGRGGCTDPADPADLAAPGAPWVDLQVTSNFTFLTGASHPEELVHRAAALGHEAIAITDTNTLAGVVRGHVAAGEVGIPLIVGARLELEADEGRLRGVLVYPQNRAAYGRLCRLLTTGRRRAPKGSCHLVLHDLCAMHEDLLAIIETPPIITGAFIDVVEGLARVFDGDRLSLGVARLCGSDDDAHVGRCADLARATGVPLVAVNDVHMHEPQRRRLQDVVTCVRLGCTLESAGRRLHPNAERTLRTPARMRRLFAAHPEAVDRAAAIARRAANFSLSELRYEYPDEVCPAGRTPDAHLRDLTTIGAGRRYPAGVPAPVQRTIDRELTLIAELRYAPYFLTIHDLVGFARGRGILCQGRGAAANSAVCYCLEITAVDPARIDLLFERFISKERDEPPDIDIDFEHERREEVIQYIYRRWGRDRAALTAVVVSYRWRSAIREVGKVLGLSLDCVESMAKGIEWWRDARSDPDRIRDAGVDPDEPTIHLAIELAHELVGFPRHLSQHVGGFVITRDDLCTTVPIENAAMPGRTVIEWDKDDIDAMGILKVDVLGLGMLTCIRKCLEMVNAGAGRTASTRPVNTAAVNARPATTGAGGLATVTEVRGIGSESATSPGNTGGDRARDACGTSTGVASTAPRQLTLATVPAEDAGVYDMICRADTVGVFQIESRAQMSMLPRLQPRCFYDLVIEVAIVRPGPIQGDMVHPYLRRRRGEEAVVYPNDEVRRVLGRTLGVPLFQEQAMAMAMVAGGFTAGQAERLRRAMATWKRRPTAIEALGEQLIQGMLERGYDRAFADRCVQQIRGFSEYGFPESHAASFALLVYVSCWLKHHHPAAFAAALLNSQPMGFYAPAQLVRDAREHGVAVRPVDVNHSAVDCTLEPGSTGPALRLGLRLVKGLPRESAQAVHDAVQHHGRFDDPCPLGRAANVGLAVLRRLARADAFASMGLDRQAALWRLARLRDHPLPLFDAIDEREVAPPPKLPARGDRSAALRDDDSAICLPPVAPPMQVAYDYASTGLSLKAHPISFLRSDLDRRGVIPARELADAQRTPDGVRRAACGLVLLRQRPATASGMVFMTIEDETGIANLVLHPKVYERCRRVARHATALIAHGRVERDGLVVHLVCRWVEDTAPHGRVPSARSRDFH